MSAILTYLQTNGTKMLGLAQGTIATLCGMGGLIPDYQMKYWLAASAVLTFWRGSANTQAIASAVAEKHMETIATLQAAQSAPLVISQLESKQ